MEAIVESHATTWHDGGVAVRTEAGEVVALAAERVGDRFKHSWNSGLAYDHLRSRREYSGAFGGAHDNFIDTRDGLDTKGDHHLFHAASAYFASGFSDAAVMVVDGQGPRHGHVASTSIWQAKGKDLDCIEELSEGEPPFAAGSIGHFYTAIGALVGMGLDHEGKTMALAAYGGPSPFLDFLRARVLCESDGRFTIDPLFTLAVFENTFGPRYYQWEKCRPGCSELWHEILELRAAMEAAEGYDARRVDMDVAFAGQALLEDIMLGVANRARSLTGAARLCLAGGVALNCVANERLTRDAGFESVYVVPAPADDGQALGKLYLSVAELEDGHPPALTSPYLGPDYSANEIEATLEMRAGRCRYVRLDEKELLEEIVEWLCSGMVIATCYGRSELGPRALGHRSILADPRPSWMRDHINLGVKSREWYRPLAPMVTEEAAEKYFDLTEPSPYMTRAVRVRPKYASTIPAVVHKDGTARLQTVTREQDARCHQLLCLFEARSGIPILLNTSFNRRDEPLVETPADALEAFQNMNVDALVLGDYLVKKV